MGTESDELRNRRLYKSSQNKLIDGVCGGVAEFLGIDATLVRLGWIVLTFVGAEIMIPAYIAGMIIMPRERDLPSEEQPDDPPSRAKGGNAALILVLGALLVLWGSAMLLHNFLPVSWPFWRLWRFWDWDRDIVGGILLIFLGALLAVSGRRSGTPRIREESTQAGPRKELTRCTEDRMMAGVCSGLGRHFGIDPSLIRIGWALGTLLSAMIGGIVVYILLWIVLPEAPKQVDPTSSPEDEIEPSENG